MQVPSHRERTQPFSVSSLLQLCHVALLTSTTLKAISSSCLRTLTLRPTLLEGLTEVDVLHIALGCRFALDIFTISQRHSPTPDHEPLPHDPEFSTF